MKHGGIKGLLLLTLVVQKWGTDEVASWLELLSLGEYKERFIRHDIRGSELLHLERRDLKVLPLKTIVLIFPLHLRPFLHHPFLSLPCPTPCNSSLSILCCAWLGLLYSVIWSNIFQQNWLSLIFDICMLSSWSCLFTRHFIHHTWKYFSFYSTLYMCKRWTKCPAVIFLWSEYRRKINVFYLLYVLFLPLTLLLFCSLSSLDCVRFTCWVWLNAQESLVRFLDKFIRI